MAQKTTRPSAAFLFSAETRWFIPGQIPGAVLRWFLGRIEPLAPAARTDIYLLFPRSSTSGVKFREERFEIKSLVEDHGPVEFVPGIPGNMETWEKWSASGPSIPDFLKDMRRHHSTWLEVRKNRYLRTFGVGRYTVNEAAPGSQQDSLREGCYAELTEVETGKERFWTFGLEAFSDAGKHQGHLRKAAEHILGEGNRETGELERLLLLKRSLSYPVFLQGVPL